MKAVFVELPAFSRCLADYLDDEGYRALQNELLNNPEAGDVIKGTGGLRVIYYLWAGGPEFLLFTLYDKDEMSDLTAKERRAFAEALKAELEKLR